MLRKLPLRLKSCKKGIFIVKENKQRLSKFSDKLSNKNKQRPWKLEKLETSLFFTALLIKYDKCT